MRCRQMRSSDCPAVSRLLQQSFPTEVAPFIPFTQHGVGEHLDVQLSHPASFSARQLLVVADADDHPIGYADFRLDTPCDGFLSYICIAPSVRGRGLAQRLIELFLQVHPGVDTLSLDVFEGNAPASKLYERLGFSVVTRQAWLTRPLPRSTSELAVYEVPTVVAMHKVFGFSEFRLNWGGEDLSFGRVGDSVLRCRDEKTFRSDELLAALRATFTGLTQAMLVVNGDASLPPDSQVLTVANRMRLGAIGAARRMETY